MSNKVRRWGGWEANEVAFARGGQGHVYKVQDTTGKHVGRFVLKELLNPKRSERFNNEIKAITELPQHPHIIEIVDFGAYKDVQKPTYVMPEADCSLEKYIHERKGKLDVVERLDIFRNIVSGVEHLHAHGIIHRDIKPDNVLIFSGAPKISDFGLCLIADLPRVTVTEEAVGPRYYMAPELEDGRCLEVGFSADIYSLGKVLYFLLSEGLVFSREKFNLRNWDLASLRADDRFQIFGAIFRRTIVESVYQRASCLELKADILEAREEYLSHPLTTLEKKIPGILASLDGTAQQLSNLNEAEWVELLKLRGKHDAPWSATIISLTFESLTNKTAELFALELFRCKDVISAAQMMPMASKLISLYDGFMMSKSNFDYFVSLALDADDSNGVNAAAKIFNLRNPEALRKIALRSTELEPESLLSFVMKSSSLSFPGRERFLLGVSRGSCTPDVLGFTIAGLMHEGSEIAIDRVAELFRELSSIEDLPEAFQGIALSRESQPSIKKLLDRGGYSESIEMSLSIIADISLKVVKKLDKKKKEKKKKKKKKFSE
ncbi:Serine/threonine protein kinase [Pseudomonas syringae]|uniref:serine/threonine protein kinase n=1 Tax=Pseudomonas syringae TaxID=317 RepID=UPI0008DF34F4|nr:serine/threonine-protein kinase [Pseudomonas syringae]SFI22848.1 Serine/threonine protein kinase [Pseudomonas syringae]